MNTEFFWNISFKIMFSIIPDSTSTYFIAAQIDTKKTNRIVINDHF